ncbi:hypothetical protein QJS04_geneDACA023962 [Acorus gramineus]|uniref:Uncharacterized protein n=1 Tax=Acorus gramineus TaxID=55184 RepID=A0AAV8ZWK8_ACOGR|nr:hypothetical protein QJS04_geneDACA023962 [Acorus gramineus]
MTRRCSHCSINGHNSRTCPSRGGGGAASPVAGGGVRLFGVRLTDGSSIRKSASMGNLSSSAEHAGERSTVAGGYVSDDAAHGSGSSNRGRKKGIPWTEEEHCMFLVGLKKLGKGDWRGIARDYVVSRTPTQVASHAQKYFIRQTNSTRRKRRPSLFDMVTEPLIPAFYLPYIPLPIPIWPYSPVLPFNTENKNQETHVIKPTPVLKETINVDDIVGMSNRMSLGSLTLKLHSSPSRPSAFHASRGQSSSTSAIHAV